jgi:hypothetical protein
VIYVRAALNIPSLDSPLQGQGRLKVANHTLDEGEATATQARSSDWREVRRQQI